MRLGTIIRVGDSTPIPWKNGMGMTREIAVQPSESSGDAFVWRASVAEVDSAAPFSSFPGIDRHIVLLSGAGFTMTLDGKHRHALHAPFEPFAFAGESSVSVTLAGGSTQDFNLMVRRGSARGEVEVLRKPGAHALHASTVLIYAARGEVRTPGGNLHVGDAWLAADSTNGMIILHDDAIALAVRIEAAL